jgi:hypothetical protein
MVWTEYLDNVQVSVKGPPIGGKPRLLSENFLGALLTDASQHQADWICGERRTASVLWFA